MSDRAKLEGAIAAFKTLSSLAGSSLYGKTLIAAAEAHLATLPKMVKVYHVEYVGNDRKPHVNVVVGNEQFEDGHVLARDEADRVKSCGCTFIRVTGPHMQEVPS